MFQAKTLPSNPVVAISYGESVRWKNKGALPHGAKGPLGPTIRPIARALLEAANACTIPCCLREDEWACVMLGDNMGSPTGRTVSHLAFLLVHRSVDIRGKNVAEALWRAFDDGVVFANSIRLGELKAAQREADLALRKVA